MFDIGVIFVNLAELLGCIVLTGLFIILVSIVAVLVGMFVKAAIATIFSRSDKTPPMSKEDMAKLAFMKIMMEAAKKRREESEAGNEEADEKEE